MGHATKRKLARKLLLRSRNGKVDVKKMSDLDPFVHGEEGTHGCCAERAREEGGKARCCSCVPCPYCREPIVPH